MKVFVTGGSGYVGRVVIERLLAANHHVVALQRPASTRSIDSRHVETVEGDLFDRVTLLHGLAHADAVIHLVGIIRQVPRRGITMHRIHVEGTRLVLEAAAQSGVQRMVHMSALGARPGAISAYHRSKWYAEEAVRDSGLTYTIFRPSVIFGRGGPGPEFVGQLTDLVRKTPVTPVIGHGRYPLQPVSITTVADAFTAALALPIAENRVYELGGPDVVTYADILRRIAEAHGQTLRTIRIPAVLMSAMIPWLQRLPGFPLTVDQLTMLLEGNVCTDTETVYRDLALSAVPFAVR